MNNHFAQTRSVLIRNQFPNGIPRLWCPTLTHFAAKGRLDPARILRHMEVLAPYVKGILVPGTTGEAWEMNDDETLELLNVVLEPARALHMHVLIGVLKPTLAGMLDCLDKMQDLYASKAAGFTICPPKGASLSQAELFNAIAQVLDRGQPTALYQLPQVTQNELSPETVQTLARLYPNFFLLKDTSGQDLVALSGLDLEGVFLVRGAEGDYAQWPKAAGGPYDGFLLSTANVFARELLQLLDGRQDGDNVILSQRLSRVIEGCFKFIGHFPTGNPFTNTNKALDHIMAYGPGALKKDPPLLYSGLPLPKRFIELAIDLLRQNSLMPAKGYYG